MLSEFPQLLLLLLQVLGYILSQIYDKIWGHIIFNLMCVYYSILGIEPNSSPVMVPKTLLLD